MELKYTKNKIKGVVKRTKIKGKIHKGKNTRQNMIAHVEFDSPFNSTILSCRYTRNDF